MLRNTSLIVLSVSFGFFSIHLLSVLRGHSVFSSPPQRPMSSDFEGFSMLSLKSHDKKDLTPEACLKTFLKLVSCVNNK